MHANMQLVTFEKWSLTVPYCTPFWDFNLGGDVLKNIFLQYMFQKPSQYICSPLFSGAQTDDLYKIICNYIYIVVINCGWNNNVAVKIVAC